MACELHNQVTVAIARAVERSGFASSGVTGTFGHAAAQGGGAIDDDLSKAIVGGLSAVENAHAGFVKMEQGLPFHLLQRVRAREIDFWARVLGKALASPAGQKTSTPK